MLSRTVVVLVLPHKHPLTGNSTLSFLPTGMHRKSMEAAETLKNDDSGASDREDTASKASDSSLHSPPHSRSFSSNGTNGEQNNNKISMGNHNPHSPGGVTPLSTGQISKERSPSALNTTTPEAPANMHHSQLPPPMGLHNGKHSVLSPPAPGYPQHHHHHLHSGHPLHAHLMHPGMSPTHPQRTTPPPHHPPSAMAHHSNGLSALDVSTKGLAPTPSAVAAAAAFHPESDPEAFRWVNSFHREPISMIR